MVKFATNANAQLHFNGPQHRNRIMLIMQRQPKIWCKICCCELNTNKALELHNQSPKHRKKEEAYAEIMQLKQDYKSSSNQNAQSDLNETTSN